MTFLDLVGRLIIIERKDALVWGYDPAAVPVNVGDLEREVSTPEMAQVEGGTSDRSEAVKSSNKEKQADGIPEGTEQPISANQKTSLIKVIGKLSKSSRALTALLIVAAYG